jgi:hypothetical protein
MQMPVTHLSKTQPMNETGIEIDSPLRAAFTPCRLHPENRQFLKTARVRPSMDAPCCFASVKVQLMATKCDVPPGNVVKLQSPEREITMFSKYIRAAAFS